MLEGVTIVAELPDMGKKYSDQFKTLLKEALIYNNDTALARVRELLQSPTAYTEFLTAEVS